MAEVGVMDGGIILAIVTSPIPVHAASATIVIVLPATGMKVPARKVEMKAAVAMNVVMEVAHVVTARAVAAVRDDRTKALAATRMAEIGRAHV